MLLIGATGTGRTMLCCGFGFEFAVLKEELSCYYRALVLQEIILLLFELEEEINRGSKFG